MIVTLQPRVPVNLRTLPGISPDSFIVVEPVSPGVNVKVWGQDADNYLTTRSGHPVASTGDEPAIWVSSVVTAGLEVTEC